MKKIKSIDDFTSKLLENTFSNHTNMIVIYVPEDVNLKVTSESGALMVENDIFLDEFSFALLALIYIFLVLTQLIYVL